MTVEKLPAAIGSVAEEHGLSMATMLDLYRHRNDEVWTKRIFTTWAHSVHRSFDVAMYESTMKALRARTSLTEAATEAILKELAFREAQDKLRNHGSDAERTKAATRRADDLAAAKHKTDLLREEAEQRRLVRDGEPPAPAPASSAPPSPQEQFRRRVAAKLDGIARDRTTRAKRAEVVQILADADIKVAELNGDKRLAEDLARERDRLIGDINSGEHEG